MHGETPEQRKGRALFELAALAAPLRDLRPGVRGAVEQVEANRVADAPVVEVPAPAVHLRGRDLGRIVDERADHARLVHARVPESRGELVVTPELLAERLHVLHRHAECLVRRDGITRHAVARRLGAVALQPRERRLHLILERRLLRLTGRRYLLFPGDGLPGHRFQLLGARAIVRDRDPIADLDRASVTPWSGTGGGLTDSAGGPTRRVDSAGARSTYQWGARYGLRLECCGGVRS